MIEADAADHAFSGFGTGEPGAGLWVYRCSDPDRFGIVATGGAMVEVLGPDASPTDHLDWVETGRCDDDGLETASLEIDGMIGAWSFSFTEVEGWQPARTSVHRQQFRRGLSATGAASA